MATITGLSFLSGHRSIISWVTGTSAVLVAAYLISATFQTPPQGGLHRSNAVRRARRRPIHQHILQPAATMDEADFDHLLGQIQFFDTDIQLHRPNPDIISATRLREIALSIHPDREPATLEAEIEEFYKTYLDRLLYCYYQNLPLQTEDLSQLRQAFEPYLSQQHIDYTFLIQEAHRLQNPPEGVSVPHQPPSPSVAGTEQPLQGEDEAGRGRGENAAQALQRLIYHIAEERSLTEGVIHRGITCNECSTTPIRGIRWHCTNCHDYELCSDCEAKNLHPKTHIFYKIRIPAPHLALPRQPLLYPGRPDQMPSSLRSALKKDLVMATGLPVEQMEALWEQFTCLASQEWENDPDGIGWAIGQRSFNQTFIPRYSSFKPKPNLVYERIFRYFDRDYDGLIGFRAFVEGISCVHTRDSRTRRRMVFDGYDLDQDGYISRQDMLRLFNAWYAIQQEATRNHVIEQTKNLSLEDAQALDNIRSTRPLGSVFEMVPAPASSSPLLAEKVDDQSGDYMAGPALPYELDRGVQSDAIPLAPDQDRPRCSRSSSRVRFQDDVDTETRSNASASSRPIGERWGGYEIPGLDKDLGRDVLYQITQEAFNEMLDRFFHLKEHYSLIVSRSKGPRQKYANELRRLSDEFKEDRKLCNALSQLPMDTIPDYSENTVSFAWKRIMNSPEVQQITKTSRLTRAELHNTVNRCFKSAEQDDWYPEQILPTNESPDIFDLWHAFFIRKHIMHELKEAVTKLFSKCGWLDPDSVDPDDEIPDDLRYPGEMEDKLKEEKVDKQIEEARTSRLRRGWLDPDSADPDEKLDVCRDQTWPQFRPNSLADSVPGSESTNQTPGVPNNSTPWQHRRNEAESWLTHDALPGELDFIKSHPTFVDYERVRGIPKIVPFEEIAIEPRAEEDYRKWSRDNEQKFGWYVANWTLTRQPTTLRMTGSGPSLVRAYRYEEPDDRVTDPFHRYLRLAALSSPSKTRRLCYLAMLRALKRQNTERNGDARLDFAEFEHLLAKRDQLRYVEMWTDCISF